MSFDYPVLDPQNESELTERAKNYAFQVSEGIISDFSQAGVLDTLIRTQAYTHAELLSYVNKLPLSIAFQVLEFAGVTRNEGTKGTAIVRFDLIAPSSGLYIIPKGFELQSTKLGETLVYITSEILEIKSGQTTGEVAIEAVGIGTKYNVSIGQIDRFITPLSGLKSVVNIEPVAGGTDAESTDNLIERSTQALRRRAPISVIDYEEFVVESMGGGVAKCIPALSLDKNNNEPGAAHVFLLAPDGTPANQALIGKVQSELGALIHIGTKLYVSAMEILEADGYLIAQLKNDFLPSTVAENLWDAFRDFFNFNQFNPGDSILISELQAEMRLTDGLKFIEYVSVNDSAIPIPLNNGYTVPVAMSLIVELVTATGSLYKTSFGISPPMDVL
jgi:Baseplate J-like protein